MQGGAGNTGGAPAAAPAEKIDKNGLSGGSSRSQSRDRSTTGQGTGSGASMHSRPTRSAASVAVFRVTPASTD